MKLPQILSALFRRAPSHIYELEAPTPNCESLDFNFVVPDAAEDSFLELQAELVGVLKPHLNRGYDGMAFTNNDTSWSLSINGPSADNLLRMVSPVLLDFEFMHGAKCTLRYASVGAGDAREVKFAFGSE